MTKSAASTPTLPESRVRLTVNSSPCLTLFLLLVSLRDAICSLPAPGTPKPPFDFRLRHHKDPANPARKKTATTITVVCFLPRFLIFMRLPLLYFTLLDTRGS